MRLLLILLFVLGLALSALGSPLPDTTPVNGSSFDLNPKPTHSKSIDGIPHESHTKPSLTTPGTQNTPATTIPHTTPTATGSIDHPYGGPRTSLKPSAWTTLVASGTRPSGSPKPHGSGLIPSGATNTHPRPPSAPAPSNTHGPIPAGTNHPTWSEYTAWHDYTPTLTTTDRPEASGKAITTHQASPATKGPTGSEASKRAAGPPCSNPQVNPNPPFNFLCPGDEGYCEDLVISSEPPYGVTCNDE